MKRFVHHLFAVSLVGCVGTESGNPPLSPVEPGLLTAVGTPVSANPEDGIRGAARAAGSGRGEVLYFNLDRPGVGDRTTVASDGSFMFAWGAIAAGDVVRFVVEDGAEVSGPLDVRVTFGNAPDSDFEVLTPEPSCLELPTTVYGRPTDATSISVRNRCAEDVRIVSATSWREAGVEVATPLPTVVPAGLELELEVVFGPTAETFPMTLDVEVPALVRRAITFVVR